MILEPQVHQHRHQLPPRMIGGLETGTHLAAPELRLHLRQHRPQPQPTKAKLMILVKQAIPRERLPQIGTRPPRRRHRQVLALAKAKNLALAPLRLHQPLLLFQLI